MLVDNIHTGYFKAMPQKRTFTQSTLDNFEWQDSSKAPQYFNDEAHCSDDDEGDEDEDDEPSTSDDDFIKQDNEDDSSSNPSDTDDDDETYEPESKSIATSAVDSVSDKSKKKKVEGIGTSNKSSYCLTGQIVVEVVNTGGTMIGQEDWTTIVQNFKQFDASILLVNLVYY